MTEAHLWHVMTLFTRNLSKFDPEALADVFDGFEDRGFISAAQAAELIKIFRDCENADYRYYHVICSRILDRWNTTKDAHGIGDCYHGWGSNEYMMDKILEVAQTARDSRRDSDIRMFVLEECFTFSREYGSNSKWQADSFSYKLPAFYVRLLRRLGDTNRLLER